MGRPPKYKKIVAHLHRDILYTAFGIAQLAKKHKLVKHLADVPKVKIAMAVCKSRNNFPIEGDGKVYIKGQPPTLGWFGWRWKQAYGIKKEDW